MQQAISGIRSANNGLMEAHETRPVGKFYKLGFAFSDLFLPRSKAILSRRIISVEVKLSSILTRHTAMKVTISCGPS